MACIQIRVPFMLRDTGNFVRRYFEVGERYEITGEPIVVQEGCGCGSGEFVDRLKYPITWAERSFLISEDMVVLVDCDSTVIGPTQDISDRLHAIANNPIDPKTNQVIEPFEENRDDEGRRREFNRMATFDLRSRG